MILVSACLAGMARCYDGAADPHPRVIEPVRGGRAIPFCPEQAGVSRAIVRLYSPSCGFGRIKVRGKAVPGNGVTMACLLGAGIEIEALIPGGGETT
jgi:uncharacterized protein YbbK (DUF523 family)